MAKKSKKYVEALGKIDRTKLYESKEEQLFLNLP